MKKWSIDIKDETNYIIEAETQEEAVEKAWDFWIERGPDIYVERVKED